MKKGATKKITLTVNVSGITDLEDLSILKLVVAITVNEVEVLRYIKGGGAGYDGDIEVDATNKKVCYVYITREKSLELPTGRLKAEGLIQKANVLFNPDGEWIVFDAVVDTVEPSKLIDE